MLAKKGGDPALADEATAVWRRGAGRTDVSSLDAALIACADLTGRNTRGTRAPVTGFYEDLNVFGMPTGRSSMCFPPFLCGGVRRASRLRGGDRCLSVCARLDALLRGWSWGTQNVRAEWSLGRDGKLPG